MVQMVFGPGLLQDAEALRETTIRDEHRQTHGDHGGKRQL